MKANVTAVLCVVVGLTALALPACQSKAEEKGGEHQEHNKIIVTSPKVTDTVITERYVCQIRSRRHINICALANGYLEKVLVREGQAVKEGEVMFEILPTLYKARLAAENAEAQQAQIEYDNTRKLFENKVAGNSVVSDQEVLLAKAKLDKAKAKASLAAAEAEFTHVRAKFDGLVDRLEAQTGTLVKEGEPLTTLSDNSVMWVYFNVPEARYLEHMAGLSRDDESRQVELVLANGSKFPEVGAIGAIEAKFNNETGNIPFRADFPNPKGLLRHGQTGNVLLHRTRHNSLVIPQRATFEILEKRYVFLVDKDNVAHQHEIAVQHEMDDIFVIKKGLEPTDKIVLEGVRQVRDGEKLEYEFLKPEEALATQKHPAE